jgi:hypothetical protein
MGVAVGQGRPIYLDLAPPTRFVRGLCRAVPSADSANGAELDEELHDALVVGA